MRPEREERRRGRQRTRREKRRGDRDRETLRGAPGQGQSRWGGRHPPHKKTKTSRDSPLKVRTCCCREYMETSCITTTGRTWTGESWTTRHGSDVGAGSLLSQRFGMLRPLEKWGAV